MALARKIEIQLKKIIKQLSGNIPEDDDEDNSLVPEYVIMGRGTISNTVLLRRSLSGLIEAQKLTY